MDNTQAQMTEEEMEAKINELLHQKDPDSIDPQEYFDYVKAKKQTITDEFLKNYYSNAEILLAKYKKTRQYKSMRKLVFHMKCVEKEYQLLKLGITTFVYKDDIDYFIDHVHKNVVKTIEASNYEREIPEEIADIMEMTSNIFDRFYIVFTDYTGKVEREVQAERRRKDPILFGAFRDNAAAIVSDRFYYLGDWEDDYCHLTLDKMVAEMETAGRDIKHEITNPKDLDALYAELAQLTDKENTFRVENKQVKRPQPFFDRIKTFLSGK